MSLVPRNLVSSQTAHHNQQGGVVVFPGAASVPGTPLSVVCCPLLSPPNPTGNALVRTVWVLLCSVAELKQLVGGPGGCRAAELGRGARKSCIRWERCFLQEQQTISLAQLQMSLCCGSNTIFSLSPLQHVYLYSHMLIQVK